MSKTTEVKPMSEKSWRERSCEERIDEAKKDRFEDFEKFFKDFDVREMDMYEIEERLSEFSRKISDFREIMIWPFTYVDMDAIQEFLEEAYRENIDNYLLGTTKYITVRLELSWGGPGDFILLQIDKETKEAMQGTYHYQDWFDGAVRTLNRHELEVLEALYSYLWDVS